MRRLLAGSVAAGLVLLLAASTATAAEPATPSFCQKPFVSPLIIKDLLAWISDSGDQVVAINLTDSQDSNRYSGDIETKGSGKLAPKHPLVVATTGNGQEKETIGYEYVGLTASGLHVLRTWEEGGGTLVATNLLFLAAEEDRGITEASIDSNGDTLHLTRRRLLLRKVGEVALGDRWVGELRVDGNKIFVGRDQGLHASNKKDLVLRLDDSAKRPAILRPCS